MFVSRRFLQDQQQHRIRYKLRVFSSRRYGLCLSRTTTRPSPRPLISISDNYRQSRGLIYISILRKVQAFSCAYRLQSRFSIIVPAGDLSGSFCPPCSSSGHLSIPNSSPSFLLLTKKTLCRRSSLSTQIRVILRRIVSFLPIARICSALKFCATLVRPQIISHHGGQNGAVQAGGAG